jgi:hypothetical protein
MHGKAKNQALFCPYFVKETAQGTKMALFYLYSHPLIPKKRYFYPLDLLRGVSEVGKKSHFLSTRRLFEGV